MHFAPPKDELVLLRSEPGKGLEMDLGRSDIDETRVRIDNREAHEGSKHYE